MSVLTPENLTIQPRRIDFGLPDPLPRHWLGGDPFKTHFFNAMSLLFPDGERFLSTPSGTFAIGLPTRSNRL
ncbi:metal-dependent hydrolase [Halopseudomonas pachastrellae]|nr:metal-dependent hydrolase [Halopseudomonas pachastrellae]